MEAKELIERYNRGERDFIGANLDGVDLIGANLDGANLKCAYLKCANLKCANLKCANLSGAYLSGANLSGANLSGSNLSGSNLSGADLSGAYLKCANLSGAYLKCANLSGANIVYFKFKFDKHDGIAIKDQIQIGCEIHQTEWWLENYIRVGYENKYSDNEIEDYGEMIKYCDNYFKKLSNRK